MANDDHTGAKTQVQAARVVGLQGRADQARGWLPPLPSFTGHRRAGGQGLNVRVEYASRPSVASHKTSESRIVVKLFRGGLELGRHDQHTCSPGLALFCNLVESQFPQGTIPASSMSQTRPLARMRQAERPGTVVRPAQCWAIREIRTSVRAHRWDRVGRQYGMSGHWSPACLVKRRPVLP